MTNSNSNLLPAEVSKQLPIFQILGNQLPDRLKTPEAKKAAAKVIFWILFVGIGVGFMMALPTLLKMAKMSVLLIGYSILAITLAGLAPKIIRLLHRLGRILIFKADKKMTQQFGIESLELSLEDVRDAKQAVRERITQVEAVQIGMYNDSQEMNKESEQKFRNVKTLTEEAVQKKKDAEKADGSGNKEKGNSLRREVAQLTTAASLRKTEGEAARELATSYAQYANEFAGALEVLKDNETAAKIYESLLTSSITIVRKKLEATGKMRSATQGLAEIFQVEDTWRFQVAMEAVNAKISDNVANIRRNLEFLNESKLNVIEQTKSLPELEAFVSKLNSGEIQKLNVEEMTDASYEWKQSEKADKGFNILS